MENDVPNSRAPVRRVLVRTKTDLAPKGSGAKRVGFLRGLFQKLGLAKDKLNKEGSTTPRREFQVEDASFPSVTVFDNPSEVFLRSDGTPLVRTRSVPTTNYQSTRALWEEVSTIQSFLWIPRNVTSYRDIQNQEVESRMQHLIMRCSMDGYEVTLQEAYDVLRLVEGAVGEAVEYMKVLRDFDN
ncbi:uncharacterized protein F4812DRAFT_469428 [Daldinia caldariorum]|uniref:uncharacterized protein n=1 Tax=Daldinia caldariorum TaxID=326644 RepID=UPI0020077204|nr:uncharacterized protein F4812DRAFT_469428 [Daldinia caldariorum]KAI1463125.1 hypothetical protein F4812DRAFT_469428 [Daldinia caldariorum]